MLCGARLLLLRLSAGARGREYVLDKLAVGKWVLLWIVLGEAVSLGAAGALQWLRPEANPYADMTQEQVRAARPQGQLTREVPALAAWLQLLQAAREGPWGCPVLCDMPDRAGAFVGVPQALCCVRAGLGSDAPRPGLGFGRLLLHRWMKPTRQRCRASRRDWGSAAPAQSARGRAGAHHMQRILATPKHRSIACLHMPSACSATRWLHVLAPCLGHRLCARSDAGVRAGQSSAMRRETQQQHTKVPRAGWMRRCTRSTASTWPHQGPDRAGLLSGAEPLAGSLSPAKLEQGEASACRPNKMIRTSFATYCLSNSHTAHVDSTLKPTLCSIAHHR